MTSLDAPWASPDRPDVQLVQVPPAALSALAAGDARSAEAAVPGLRIDPGLAQDHCRRVWQVRAEQVRERPADAPWVTRLLVDVDLGLALGRAGFHGAPDARGMVEVGYEVVPWARRRGYARAAMGALLAVARQRDDVHVLRATVSPDNAASRALITSLGLVEVGEQWDEEDGLETIFEVPVP